MYRSFSSWDVQIAQKRVLHSARRGGVHRPASLLEGYVGGRREVGAFKILSVSPFSVGIYSHGPFLSLPRDLTKISWSMEC